MLHVRHSAFGHDPSCRFKNTNMQNNNGQFIKPDLFRLRFEEIGRLILTLHIV